MKKLNYILGIACGALLLGSCSDFLDSNPITSLVETNFYKTETDANRALIGCYDGVQVMWSDGFAFPEAELIYSDECFGGTGIMDSYNRQVLDEFDPNRSPSEVDIFNMDWVLYYKAIYRCNMLLSKMDQIEWTSEENRNTVEAETRFLRAFIYFEMVRLWGNIPLVETPLSVEEANLPQSDPKDVYALIESDLLFACENAQLKGSQWSETWANANDGHVTVFAAKAMLARVFLFYTGYYGESTLPGGTTKAQVTAQLQDVYTSGHGLVANFADLWPGACTVRSAEDEVLGLATTFAGEANKETVWAIKFNSSGDWNGNTNGFIPMKMWGLRNGQVKSFGETCYGDGAWGSCTVVPEFVKAWDKFSSTDPRRTASVMDMAAEGVELLPTHTQREYTGYMTKKYTCLGNGASDWYTSQSLNFQINEYQDFIVIRYADVLLMLSELTEDAKYMNEVRTRAGLGEIAYSTEALRNERKYELAFEGLRFSDLLRYDSSLEYAANAISYAGTVINGGGAPATEKSIKGEMLKACKGLSQIPNTQISLSDGVLKQNEGWK